MRGRLVALAGLLLLALASPASAQTSIVVSPVTQYFPFNADRNVTFGCEVIGTALIWEVSGFQLSRDQLETGVAGLVYVEDGTGSGMSGSISRTSTLIITVLEFSDINRNNTAIRCIARGRTDADSKKSNVVYLRTFNTPRAPPKLDITPELYPNLQLTLFWDRPGNLPGQDDVPVTYTVEAVSDSGVNYPGFPNTTSNTWLSFQDVIFNCTVYTFSVTASADSLTGNTSSIRETVPISPNMTLVTAGLVGKLSFSGQNPMLTMTFPQATTCSNSRFPIERYAVNVNGQEVAVAGLSSPLSVSVSAVDVTGFSSGEAFVLGCISVACRPSGSITFLTSSVQEASILYFGNRVLLNCVLVSGAPARGCVFRFQLPLELSDGAPPEDIFSPATSATDVMLTPNRARALPSNQDGTCEMTQNSVDVYKMITVFDWEAGGGVGTQGPAPRQTNVSTEDEPNFVCQPPSPGLSVGGIIAIAVVSVVALVFMTGGIVITILCLRSEHKGRKKISYDEGINAEALITKNQKEEKKRSRGGRNQPDRVHTAGGPPFPLSPSPSQDQERSSIGVVDMSDPEKPRMKLTCRSGKLKDLWEQRSSDSGEMLLLCDFPKRPTSPEQPEAAQ